jgi:hypothetical protein
LYREEGTSAEETANISEMGLSLLTAYPGLYPVCVSCGNPCALGWKSSKLSTAYHPQGTGYKMGTLPAELVTMQDDWSTSRIMMEKRESIQPETLGGKVCGERGKAHPTLGWGLCIGGIHASIDFAGSAEGQGCWTIASQSSSTAAFASSQNILWAELSMTTRDTFAIKLDATGTHYGFVMPTETLNMPLDDFVWSSHRSV